MKEAVLSSKLTRLNIDEVAYKRWHARWVSYFSTLHMSGSRYMPSQVPALDACAYASCYNASKSIFFFRRKLLPRMYTESNKHGFHCGDRHETLKTCWPYAERK